VKVIVQPGDGVAPLIKAIDGAKKSIEVVIFRLNRRELEKAFGDAVARGVHVHALIAHTNRGGEKSLRELELRLLGAGITVARTDHELVRYHGKMMLVDRRVLYVLAFNFTYLDMERSRSFGIVTTNKNHVREAARLFEADTNRHAYTAGSASFVVSPVNARGQLSKFIRSAKKELLIYDPDVSDPAMVRVLEARVRAGVNVQIIGKLAAETSIIAKPQMLQIRLHTRTIVRDGTWAFVGSQSLRALELDSRREIGIIFRDPKAVSQIAKIFRADWESGGTVAAEPLTPQEAAALDSASASRVARKVAKAVANGLGPVTPVVETTVREIAGEMPKVDLNEREIEETVKNAVKDAVKQVVRDFVEEAVEAHDVEAKT
jgi:phosphatidylserine/phosphatidylglycerophosphate/cardiolipin synthase-like enzyme